MSAFTADKQSLAGAQWLWHREVRVPFVSTLGAWSACIGLMVGTHQGPYAVADEVPK